MTRIELIEYLKQIPGLHHDMITEPMSNKKINVYYFNTEPISFADALMPIPWSIKTFYLVISVPETFHVTSLLWFLSDREYKPDIVDDPSFEENCLWKNLRKQHDILNVLDHIQNKGDFNSLIYPYLSFLLSIKFTYEIEELFL